MNARCEGSLQGNGLNTADIFLRPELSDQLRRICNSQQILGGSGFFRGQATNAPSVLSEQSEFTELSTRDGLLLRRNYDPSVSSGLDDVQARFAIQCLAVEFGKKR